MSTLSPAQVVPRALAIAAQGVFADATVLVVDDQSANVTLLERLLRAAGVARVHGLTDPTQAVGRCLELRPDLVLLDLHMPVVDGFTVLEALAKAVGADEFLPVLVLTADVAPEAKERALVAGAKDFLTKPFDRTEVLLRVHNLLETRALYARLERDKARLRAELEERKAQERRLLAERRRRRRRIERVLDSHALPMVFQPIADLANGRVVGVEALARFECQPRRPPNEWFAEAAEVGLGVELELAAVGAALVALSRLPLDTFLSVNVSPATAVAPAFAALLARWTGRRLVVELTEHTRVEHYEPLLAALDGLRQRSMRIAVDDAGAGYAGLQHILRLRPEVIKLDTDLTRGIHLDPARRALAASLVTFAHDIGAAILAEGVETRLELDVLRSLGVPWGQGYHLARPGPLPLPSPYLTELAGAQFHLGNGADHGSGP
jgi:EAL domain-containing protein (putative c-di-GMP-specific phosphodiesterase class I)